MNYGAGNLVRLFIKTGSVETVNEALALVDSTEVPRKQDCVLDGDPEVLDTDTELISWIKSVVAMQMKGRKSEPSPRRRQDSVSQACQRFDTEAGLPLLETASSSSGHGE